MELKEFIKTISDITDAISELQFGVAAMQI